LDDDIKAFKSQIAAWCNGGSKGRKLHIAENGDVFIRESGIRNRMKVGPSKIVGRNEPCICGSGKKYKKCCGGN